MPRPVRGRQAQPGADSSRVNAQPAKGEVSVLHIDMARGARTLIEQCVGVRPGENVLIVTDTGRDFSIAESLAAAVEAAGGKSAIILTRPLARAGEEPLPPVAGAMAAADVIISPTTRAIFHTRTVKDSRSQRKARFFALSEAEARTLISGPFDADFVKQKPLVDALARRMVTGKGVRITSPGGIDLSLDIRRTTAQRQHRHVQEPR